MMGDIVVCFLGLGLILGLVDGGMKDEYLIFSTFII